MYFRRRIKLTRSIWGRGGGLKLPQLSNTPPILCFLCYDGSDFLSAIRLDIILLCIQPNIRPGIRSKFGLYIRSIPRKKQGLFNPGKKAKTDQNGSLLRYYYFIIHATSFLHSHNSSNTHFFNISLSKQNSANFFPYSLIHSIDILYDYK